MNMIFTPSGNTRSAWSERFPLILPKSIPGVLVERARHRQHGALGRWPASNKSSIFPSGTLVVVFSKSLRMKKRVWVITGRKLGDEQCSFIEGCPAEWEALPEPAEPLVMGGMFLHGRARIARQ